MKAIGRRRGGAPVAAIGASGTPRWIAVFAAAGALEAGLAWGIASGAWDIAGRWRVPLLLGLWAGAWLVASPSALRLPRRPAVAVILAAGVALRLAALAGPPTTSDDLFRYSWDGRVQAAGIDAYAQPPAAAPLAGLREAWLWPGPAGCGEIAKPPGCTRMNRPDARTIYPPIAEAWFAGVYRVAGIGARHKAWQVAGLATEMATLGLLVVALRRWGRDPRWLALYALCPAPVLEIVNNGHVDGLAIALVVAAMIVVAPPWRPGPLKGRDVAVGAPETPKEPMVAAASRSASPWRDVAGAALLGAAVLVKLYPAVLLLPLVACRPARRLAAGLRATVTVAVLAGVAYAPHVARVGSRVLGYLPGYLREEHYQGGGRFLIAHVLRIGPAAAGLVSVMGIGLVAVWILVRRPSLPLASTAIVAALLLASSPAQPWYAVTLLALATVAQRPEFSAVAAAGYVAAFASVLDRPGSPRTGGWAYTAALVFIAVPAVWRRRAPASAPAGTGTGLAGTGPAGTGPAGTTPAGPGPRGAAPANLASGARPEGMDVFDGDGP